MASSGESKRQMISANENIKQFRRGLVVGKFCPLHRGHEMLIQHAISNCEDVFVISYSKPEFIECPPYERKRWIQTLFPTVKVLVLDDGLLHRLCEQQKLLAIQMPDNDAPDTKHREFVGWLCWEILHLTVDVVFTSENYGDGFAESLTAYFKARSNKSPKVKHICVDKQRNLIPTSGTKIRSNPHKHKQFLSPEVYATFVERICILGGESSGKTTLANALAKHFNTAWVPEYGRELWDEKEGALQYEDMLKIGMEQVNRENILAPSANQWLFCDTSPLTTLFYSLSMFNHANDQLIELTYRRYDVYFLCEPDFPFVQDGTRKNDDFRHLQQAWYLKEMNDRAIPFYKLSGSLDTRIAKVKNILD